MLGLLRQINQMVWFLPGLFSYVGLNCLHLGVGGGVYYIPNMMVRCSLLFEIIPFSGDSSIVRLQ